MRPIHFHTDDDRKNLGNLKTIIQDLAEILPKLSTQRRLQLGALLFLQIISGLTEIISLGAVLPFLSALSNASELLQKEEFSSIFQFLNISTEKHLIIASSAAFVTSFIIVNCFKFFTFWCQIRISCAIGNDLNKVIYKKLLHQDFEYYLSTNSSTIVSRFVQDLQTTLNFISSSITIVTQCVTIIAITMAIFLYNPQMACILTLSTAFLYSVISMFNKKKIVYSGEVVSNSRAKVINILHVSLGGIRDILLGNKQDVQVKRFSEADRNFRYSTAKARLLTVAPRYALELIAVTILVSMGAFYTLSAGGLFGALPMMGALAMATVRILPSAQAIYASYAKMQNQHISVVRALKLLNLSNKLEDDNDATSTQDITLNDHISLENIWFRFHTKDDSEKKFSDWILKDVTIKIPINKTIAFVGKTGSGKTTLSDIILGLLLPEKGCIKIDNKEINRSTLKQWRNLTASVPQSIFLMDATIKENVAFGTEIDKIDLDKVKKSCQLAQIDELVDSRPQKYDEIIGENGLRLSGGQRQRIGIARALYKGASVLVMDEATSSLDNKTEKNVMETISNLHGQQTIILIAHRLETIKKADIIFEIQNGSVVAQGSYEELLKNSESFREIALKETNKEKVA